MELVTVRDEIRSVARRWQEQYRRFGTWATYTGSAWKQQPEAVHEALLGIDVETVDAGEVNRIIGNTLWTEVRCNECMEAFERAVNFACGEYTLTICRSCLLDAVAIVDGEVK